MNKDDFVCFKDPEGAYLIADRVVAEEFCYEGKPPDEVSSDTLARIRNKQREFNEQRANEMAALKTVSVPGLLEHSDGASVNGLLGPADGEELRGDSDSPPAPGPETGGDNLEGRERPLGDVQADEAGREAGDAQVLAVFLPRSSTGDSDHRRERKPEAVTVPA